MAVRRRPLLKKGTIIFNSQEATPKAVRRRRQWLSGGDGNGDCEWYPQEELHSRRLVRRQKSYLLNDGDKW